MRRLRLSKTTIIITTIKIVARHTITGGERTTMEVLKETDNVIIYKNNNGRVDYRFKVKDAERIIEGVK